ncbi:MAG: flagellar motor switch phosphatase FliY [Sporanaerobacter sp.]|uniref:flagellar motor switch phosphatase FliY n=1 Tax=Sporanaerobacter sp. TaxID=2010183 RepID=UPI003A100101
MTNDMLSQDEIDALLRGNTENEENTGENHEYESEIGDLEKDALGEIGNISMGTAATTLSTLLNQKVIITTPNVEETTIDKLADEYPIPFVAIDVSYKAGLEGSNILILKVDDVKIITDILMGKEEIDLDRELTELDLSAVSEVMNQMMGSACTSLSEIFTTKIDIQPPKSYEITFSEGKDKLEIFKNDKRLIKISFKMVVGDLIDSQIMQLIPIDFAKETVNNLLGRNSKEPQNDVSIEPTINLEDFPVHEEKEASKIEQAQKHLVDDENILSNRMQGKENSAVTVKKPVFETFDNETKFSYNESIELVGEIPVELTVELGRTTKKIGEILEYGPGTIIELDKLVGEPLNVYANGKFIAKGEVVVIDDNFGVRITDVVNSYNKTNY